MTLATAEGLSDLISALGTVHGVVTVDSRRRDEEDDAYVLFRYGTSNRELSSFVAQLGPALRLAVPDAEFALLLVWFAGRKELLALLSARHGSLCDVAAAVRAMADDRLAMH